MKGLDIMSSNDNISSVAELVEPVPKAHVMKRIASILTNGSVGFTKHARKEMKDDDLDETDIFNVLKRGCCEEYEFRTGSWRYRLRIDRIVVIVAFRSVSEVTMVTVWKDRR